MIFHLVEPSPWPILSSSLLISVTISSVCLLQGLEGTYLKLLILLSILSLLWVIYLWFRDIVVEGTYLGEHTVIVQKGLLLGLGLFIVSEVIFFFSLFWAYFHSALSPDVSLGGYWPPIGINALDPYTIPLLNTLLLLSSAGTVTYAHHVWIAGNRLQAINAILITILLAIIFTISQIREYYLCPFTIADSVYGSTFFILTGFHGFHVIIGTIFLTVSLFRIINNHFTNNHLLGFECAILYWHFVDIVWLFLYLSIYLW